MDRLDPGIWEFDAYERVIGGFLPHRPSFSSSSLSSSPCLAYIDVVPSPPVLAHPSVAPVAPSSSAGASCMTCIATIHTARAGLLQQHDTERDALRDHKATARLLDAPRAYDLAPDASALQFLDVHVALVSGDSLRTAAGYATPFGPAASIPSHTLFPSPPARDDHL
ncbi:hypothetical protein B0H14DRAFT_3453128 [Mycena olivaceomarginata]|nr:hypothetical protein B0H14DRAFT_3453128 [Mycena olivaceomarginata]